MAGRKKKSEDESRVHRLPVRVTLDERRRYKQNAREQGMTVSEFARRRMDYRPIVADQAAKVDAQLISELNRLSVSLRSGVGNNLNQLVKDWNAGRDPRLDWHQTHDHLNETLISLQVLIGQIAEAYE